MLATEHAQLVREMAYLIWLERGQPDGDPLHDWIKAEELIDTARHRNGLQELRCGLKELPCGLRELI
jgi:hypothetical protein